MELKKERPREGGENRSGGGSAFAAGGKLATRVAGSSAGIANGAARNGMERSTVELAQCASGNGVLDLWQCEGSQHGGCAGGFTKLAHAMHGAPRSTPATARMRTTLVSGRPKLTPVNREAIVAPISVLLSLRELDPPSQKLVRHLTQFRTCSCSTCHQDPRPLLGAKGFHNSNQAHVWRRSPPRKCKSVLPGERFSILIQSGDK